MTKGVKRQIVTDTMGNLLSIATEKYCCDGGYRKTFVEEVQKYLRAEVMTLPPLLVLTDKK